MTQSTQRLIFQVEGVCHEIALDDRFAPATLAKVLACLPMEIDIHCAKIAGSHIMWPMPFLARLEKASDVLAMPPGAFFFWPERQYLEITYDELQAETAAISYLGRLEGDVAWLRDYAERNRRLQGRQIFTAKMFLTDGAPAPAGPDAPSEDSPWGRLSAARHAAWREPPTDVTDLLARRGLNIPFGPLSMAEGEARKLHELLTRLWDDERRYSDGERRRIAVFAIEAAISRLAGFCHMAEVGARLADGITLLRDGTVAIGSVLEELALYVGRIAAWLDLHICWWPINELTKNALDGKPLQDGCAAWGETDRR